MKATFGGLAPNKPEKHRLLKWLRYEMTVATCTAIWGPENPVNSLKTVEAF